MCIGEIKVKLCNLNHLLYISFCDIVKLFNYITNIVVSCRQTPAPEYPGSKLPHQIILSLCRLPHQDILSADSAPEHSVSRLFHQNFRSPDPSTRTSCLQTPAPDGCRWIGGNIRAFRSRVMTAKPWTCAIKVGCYGEPLLTVSALMRKT